MSRFHPSMSWNESSPSQPADNPTEESEDGPSNTDYKIFGPAKLNSAFWAELDLGDFEQASLNSHPPDSAASRPRSFLRETASATHAHRNYFLPLHYEPNYRYPLIVWLHSDGYNENQVEHVMPHISIRNYVAVGVRGVRAADSVGHRFDWPNSSAAIAAAEESVARTVDEACERFSVHPSRIILAGYGSGGTMAIRLAMRASYRYAAVVSMGGVMPTGNRVCGDLGELRRRRLPMLWQWGLHDSRFDPERLQRDIQQAMMIRAAVEIRQYPVGDEFDSVAFADLNDWVMRRVIADQSIQDSDRWSSNPRSYSAN